MKIKFLPQRRDDTLQLSMQDSTLFINGEGFNFDRLEDGDILPREAIYSDWFAGPVEVIGGIKILTLKLPNPWNYSQAQAFPEPIMVTTNGPIELPKPLTSAGMEQ